MTRPLAQVHVTVEPCNDEIVHFTEYDDGGVALCGENLEDAEEADGPVPDSTMCAECVVIHTAENALSV